MAYIKVRMGGGGGNLLTKNDLRRIIRICLIKYVKSI